MEKKKKHNIEIVVDRLVIRDDITRRLTDSVEVASNLAGGLVGGWIGGKLYGRVSVKWLKWLFAGFLFYAGVKYLL